VKSVGISILCFGFSSPVGLIVGLYLAWTPKFLAKLLNRNCCRLSRVSWALAQISCWCLWTVLLTLLGHDRMLTVIGGSVLGGFCPSLCQGESVLPRRKRGVCPKGVMFGKGVRSYFRSQYMGMLEQSAEFINTFSTMISSSPNA